MVVDVSVSFIPLLIIILLEMLMCGMDGKVFSDPAGQFQLFINLIQQQVVLFGNHTVAVAAVSGEYLETYVIYFSLQKESSP